MEKFEYLTTCINIYNENEINKLGEEGWELIQIFQNPNNTYTGIFKRKY